MVGGGASEAVGEPGSFMRGLPGETITFQRWISGDDARVMFRRHVSFGQEYQRGQDRRATHNQKQFPTTMSGRGKGGKEIGSSKKAKQAAPEAYSWTEGEEVAIISYFSCHNSHPNAYVVAWGQLHPLIATALTNKRQQARPSSAVGTGKRIARLEITLDVGDENDDLFDSTKKSDVKDHRGEVAEEGDSDDEVEDRDDVMDDIGAWVTSKLDFWSDEPDVGVKVRGMVCIN